MQKSTEKRPCPTCGGMRWAVIDSHPSPNLDTYERQRVCVSCRAVWITEERWVRQLKGPRPRSSSSLEYLG